MIYEATQTKVPKGKFQLELGEELLVIEGTARLSFTLQTVINEHYLTKASLTTVARELDLS